MARSVFIVLGALFASGAFAAQNAPVTRPHDHLRGRQDSGPITPSYPQYPPSSPPFSGPAPVPVTFPAPGPVPMPVPEPEPEPIPEPNPEPHHNRPPEVIAREEVFFNLFCTFESHFEHRKLCHAAARFKKFVDRDGDEVFDNSAYPKNPKFEVECDHAVLFNGAARRYTDREGSRFQAEAGPFPAVVLPSKTLRLGHRKVDATLEFSNTNLAGSCFIYDGQPILESNHIQLETR